MDNAALEAAKQKAAQAGFNDMELSAIGFQEDVKQPFCLAFIL